jgi:ATP phosphoribosyltransferase
LTRRFFPAAGVGHYRIVESAGATEGAPAAGAAELVVDITTTGATLESNGLKVIRDGLILDSQAQLAASLKAAWPDDVLASLRGLLQVIDARASGKGRRTLMFAPDFQPSVLGRLLAAELEQLGPGEALCEKARAHDLARTIAAAGGGPVRTFDADFVFRSENARYDRFTEALSRG